MSPKDTVDDDELETTWSPAVGDRVSLFYPEDFGKNFPTKRVGEVTHLHESGCFTVIVQPQHHCCFVDPENYAEHGATFREWVKQDGWPIQRVYTKPKENKKLRVR